MFESFTPLCHISMLLLLVFDITLSAAMNSGNEASIRGAQGRSVLTILVNNGVGPQQNHTSQGGQSRPTLPRRTTKPAPSLIATPTTTNSTFSHKGLGEELLTETNKKRKTHEAAVLTVAESLNKAAQGYAEELSVLKKMAHSSKQSRPGQGENLAQKCSMIDNRMTATEAINAFYDEVKLYNFQKPNPSDKNGHFTQLVWKASKKTGSGEAKFINDKGETCYVIVIRYVPTGNVDGGYSQNVAKGSYNEKSLFTRHVKSKTNVTITVMDNFN